MRLRPTKHQTIHRILKWVWIFPGIPVSYLLKESVPYLVFLSVYAIVAAHWSAEEAAGPGDDAV